jgi:hypothetical protein
MTTLLLLSSSSQKMTTKKDWKNKKGGEGRELTFKLEHLPLGSSSKLPCFATFLSSLAFPGS